MGRPEEYTLPGSSWRKVLDLGERLLSLAPGSLPIGAQNLAGHAYPDGGVVLSQQELILKTLTDLLGGQASLWLAPWLGQELGYLHRQQRSLHTLSPDFTDVFTNFPQAGLAAQASRPPFLLTKADNALATALLDRTDGAEATKVMGILFLHRPEGPFFESHDIEIFEGLALQARIAFQNRLHAAIERRQAEQIEATTKIAKAISPFLDLEELLAKVITLINDNYGYPSIHIYSVHPGRRKIFHEAGSSNDLDLARGAYDLDDPESLLSRVARDGETAPIRGEGQGAAPAGLLVPLKFGGEVLGILELHSDQADAFGSAEQAAFEALAGDIAIAMRNASLYRSEQWRRQIADSLQEVAGMISAQAGLEQVLNAILVELERNLPCDLAAIWFVDEDQGNGNREPDLPPLRLAAVHGSYAEWLRPQVGLSLAEIIELNDPLAPPDTPAPAWLAQAIQVGSPVTRPPADPQDLVGLAMEFSPDYSAIAAPLRAGENLLGLLTLAHDTPGRYGGEARAMTAAFANYAAVAIQNTRLYASAHDQIWVSSVLLQVAEATQSQTDIDELLGTVARLTPLLAGVKACAIYTLDDDETFHPAAEYGIASARQPDFAEQAFSPGEIPSLDLLRLEKRSTLVQNRGADARLVELVAGEAVEKLALQILVAVPLLTHGEVLGAMLVQYAQDPIRTGLQALENFFDERLSILQGIAQQTATAAENVRLLRSQQEDAYVSVAFLQVAQAIVSAGDLQETLDAIARTTPILTGVKRVAFYLFDRTCGCFRLSASYGMPHHAELYLYSPEEFPLLAAAWESGVLAAHPLDIKVPGSAYDWEDIPEVWSLLPALDPDAVEGLLDHTDRLLLAFPLTAKGAAIGVMLVEEPDAPSSLNPGRQKPNARLRSKRLEIITGISQQAALSIQNDQLRREVVVRERLEREMQLAREIQQTFLPDPLPVLPGWQINVWWRTAREMGGDFYDLIHLPGGLLGIVIADVADKGLPAALFMTLIRTLLRAVVRDELSPAEALEAVNNLLIPDAKQGTFVTIFYAVLDPVKGVLVYANAGHNPPLWVQMDRNQIELLPRSGMALGVLEDSPIEQRTITLLPGDYLVLYTDGVTDAFSPQDLPYDFERLYQTVRKTAFDSHSTNPSASAMLEAIDQSIKAFVESTPAADDSTALVFYFERGG